MNNVIICLCIFMIVFFNIFKFFKDKYKNLFHYCYALVNSFLESITVNYQQKLTVMKFDFYIKTCNMIICQGKLFLLLLQNHHLNQECKSKFQLVIHYRQFEFLTLMFHPKYFDNYRFCILYHPND